MIWYLLYPFRGLVDCEDDSLTPNPASSPRRPSRTAEAPVLELNHPLRAAFTRYGIYAARNVVTTLLVSVVVATILIYPIPFLFSTDFANGASKLPRHVWTAAQPLDYKASVEPDAIMRSVWVHGSYMDALNRDVLLGALELQDRLLGPTENFNPRKPPRIVSDTDAGFPPEDTGVGGGVDGRGAILDLDPRTRDGLHIINGLTNESWFFHSPLQYWSCSSKNIESDQDLVSTVNQCKTQPTSVNTTLRHSIVFSGKRFADRRLLASDALVITLIHLRDSPVAQNWIERARSLPPHIANKWDMYPPDGYSASSQLYEFQFRPISVQDSILLALAYALTLIYCLMSLSKLRAVRSKVGLSSAVMAQIVVSIMSSFTVCAILDVDLSRVPRASYPLVVLALSLENIFRLINAVILTPAEDSTWNRVGHAFGETMHICLASSAQNVLIFWGLSHVVHPGVSAFCIFAIVVVFFDFFYMSTFFLSVLSVDVRRTELSDSLAKASLKHSHSRYGELARQSWTEAVLQGKIALSTRISGTIVTVACVLTAQWHFFEDGSLFAFLSRLLGSNQDEEVDSSVTKPWPLGDIHQARSPTSWLRLQDHETAREVIHVVKPLAHSYVARVYEPLVFVLKGADRTPGRSESLLPPAVDDFVRHQLAPFILVAVVALAAVRLLTNYLLWEAEPESGPGSESPDDSPLSVRSLENGHSLDVDTMMASSDGHLVSIGLDRRIHVWDAHLGSSSYEITALGRPEEEFLPVLAMAIDDDSRWLALLSPSHVLLWNLADRRWAPSTPIELYGQKSEAFFFVRSPAPHAQSLIVVRRNGTMAQIWPASMEQTDWEISACPLTCATPLVHKCGNQRPSRFTIVTASRDRHLQITAQKDGEWSTRTFSLDSGLDGGDGGDVHQVLGVPVLDAVLIARHASVLLLDLRTRQPVHTFYTEQMQPRSLKLFYTRRHMLQPGPPGLSSLALIYSDASTGDCVTQAYSGLEDGEEDVVRLQEGVGPGDSSRLVWLDATQVTKHISCPGVWEVLPSGHVVGVRHKLKDRAGGAPKLVHEGDYSGLRHRKCMRGKMRRGQSGLLSWEVWLSPQPGKPDVLETQPLLKDEEATKHLLISQMGPLTKIGRNSMAVGFGNTIQIVTVGQDRGHGLFVDLDGDGEDDGFLQLGSRRRKPASHKGRLLAAPEMYGSAPELGVFQYLC